MTGRRFPVVGMAACVACALSFAGGLALTAPATLVDGALSDRTDGRLRLADARGTLWDGSGRIEVRGAGTRTDVASALAWRILPEELWRGRLSYQVTLENGTGRISVALSPWPSRIELGDADVDLPAKVLGVAAPELAPLRLTGRVHIRIARLVLDDNSARGDLIVQWRDAGSMLASVSPLGDYELRFDGAGDRARVVLRTVQGPLRLEGRTGWKNGEHPMLPVTARISPPHREELAPFLRLIAVEHSDGSFALQAGQLGKQRP